MFRYLQNIQPQKLFLEKLLYSVRLAQKPPVPETISVSPTSATIDPSSKDFRGENVVITGGGSGLGRALAIKLGRLKANIAAWDTNKEALDETVNLVKVVGGQASGYLCDLTRKEEIYRLAEKTKRELGQITMVINTDNVCSEKLLLDTPDYQIQRSFEINVLSHFWITKAFLPNMIDANRGHIVTISSMAAHMGIQKLTDFCATKAAAMCFLLALKTELEREGSRGVKTTVVCPYFMKSSGTLKNAELRLVPLLNLEEVADRTVDAIKNQETVVFIPGWFRLFMIPQWITPVTITSLLKRFLIKDPSPAGIPDVAPLKIVQFVRSAAQNSDASKDVHKIRVLDEKKDEKHI